MPGRCARAAAPPLSPSLHCCRPAPLRVVADEHCLPQEGECLRSITYPDCCCCLFAGLSWRRYPRAGPAGSLSRGSCPAALAVPLPQPLRPAAGGRRRALLASRRGASLLTMHPDCRRRLFSFGRADLGPLPLPSPPCSHSCSSAPLRAAAIEHGLLRPCSRKGYGAVRPRTLNAVAVSSPSGRAALGPQTCSLRRFPAAAALLRVRCGWSPTSAA